MKTCKNESQEEKEKLKLGALGACRLKRLLDRQEDRKNKLEAAQLAQAAAANAAAAAQAAQAAAASAQWQQWQDCSRPSWWKPKPCGTTMPTTKVKVASHTNGAGTTRPWSSLWSSPSSQSHTGNSQDWCVHILDFLQPYSFPHVCWLCLCGITGPVATGSAAAGAGAKGGGGPPQHPNTSI